MKLTEEQKGRVRAWAVEGASVADIQKRLEEELSLRLSYLDTRLLISELEVSIKDKDAPKEDKPLSPESALEDDDDLEEEELEPPSSAAGGKLSVSVDAVAQPHALVSGKVTFSDGKKAGWYVDQFGRLGLQADDPGYRPSQQDVMAFQQELQKVMRRQGY